MSNESYSTPDGAVGQALMQALWCTAAIVMAVKLATGLAFGPLAVLAIVAMIISFGLIIRLKRHPLKH